MLYTGATTRQAEPSSPAPCLRTDAVLSFVQQFTAHIPKVFSRSTRLMFGIKLLLVPSLWPGAALDPGRLFIQSPAQLPFTC